VRVTIICVLVFLLSMLVTSVVMNNPPTVAHETPACMEKYKELEEKIQKLDTKLKHFKYYQERYERKKRATKFASTEVKIPKVRVLGF
jgi:hypothetical protein